MSGVNVKVVCVAVVCMLMLVADLKPTAAQSCNEVRSRLSQCVGYLTSNNVDASPSTACCNGVRSLVDQASRSTRADRQRACRCLQQLAGSFPLPRGSPIPLLAERLPGKCTVRLPYRISTSTNCNRVN